MRYENNIDAGMFFMYNVAIDKLWTGNKSSYVVLRLLKQSMSLQMLFTACRDYFVNFEENSIITLLETLIEEGFIIEHE